MEVYPEHIDSATHHVRVIFILYLLLSPSIPCSAANPIQHATFSRSIECSGREDKLKLILWLFKLHDSFKVKILILGNNTFDL